MQKCLKVVVCPQLFFLGCPAVADDSNAFPPSQPTRSHHIKEYPKWTSLPPESLQALFTTS